MTKGWALPPGIDVKGGGRRGAYSEPHPSRYEAEQFPMLKPSGPAHLQLPHPEPALLCCPGKTQGHSPKCCRDSSLISSCKSKIKEQITYFLHTGTPICYYCKGEGSIMRKQRTKARLRTDEKTPNSAFSCLMSKCTSDWLLSALLIVTYFSLALHHTWSSPWTLCQHLGTSKANQTSPSQLYAMLL